MDHGGGCDHIYIYIHISHSRSKVPGLRSCRSIGPIKWSRSHREMVNACQSAVTAKGSAHVRALWTRGTSADRGKRRISSNSSGKARILELELLQTTAVAESDTGGTISRTRACRKRTQQTRNKHRPSAADRKGAPRACPCTEARYSSTSPQNVESTGTFQGPLGCSVECMGSCTPLNSRSHASIMGAPRV